MLFHLNIITNKHVSFYVFTAVWLNNPIFCDMIGHHWFNWFPVLPKKVMNSKSLITSTIYHISLSVILYYKELRNIRFVVTPRFSVFESSEERILKFSFPRHPENIVDKP
jgi:hypothetical protein